MQQSEIISIITSAIITFITSVVATYKLLAYRMTKVEKRFDRHEECDGIRFSKIEIDVKKNEETVSSLHLKVVEMKGILDRTSEQVDQIYKKMFNIS